MTTSTTAQSGPKRARYPSIGLQTAFDGLQRIYKVYERQEFSRAEAAEACGYSDRSGTANRLLGGLKHYGLILGRKGGGAILSERGLALCILSQDSVEFQQNLKQAALAPALFRELRELGPKSDERLSQYLQMEKRFPSAAAKNAVKTYRQTTAFANVGDEHGAGESASEPPPIDDSPKTASAVNSTPTMERADAAADRNQLTLQLPDGGAAYLDLPGTMTLRDLHYLATMIRALGHGIMGNGDPEVRVVGENDFDILPPGRAE